MIDGYVITHHVHFVSRVYNDIYSRYLFSMFAVLFIFITLHELEKSALDKP